MSSCDESNISKNYIVQSPTDFDILSAYFILIIYIIAVVVL